MKREAIEVLQEALPAGKELRGDTGEREVDVLAELAGARQRGELPKMPKIPVIVEVIEKAIAVLNAAQVEQPRTWTTLFASAQVLLPENSQKQKILDKLRKKLPSTPEDTT